MLRTVSALLIERVLIPQPIGALLRAGFCVTGPCFQDACDERLFARVGNACAELCAKTLDVGHLNQAEHAGVKIGHEIPGKKLLVAAARAGTNRNLAVQPAVSPGYGTRIFHSLIDPRICDVEPLKAAVRVSRVTERE
jgi:hypothetical protein